MTRLLSLLILLLAASLANAQLHPYFHKTYPPGENYVKAGEGTVRIVANGYIHYAFTGYRNDVNRDLILVRLTPKGDVVWKQIYNNPNNSVEQPWDMDVDAAGNTYVSGSFVKPGADQHNWLIVKFGPAGDIKWSQMSIGGPNDETISELSFDTSGNLVVVGTFAPDQTSLNGKLGVAKFRPSDGGLIWLTKIERVSSEHNPPSGLAVDRFGSAYVKTRGRLLKVSSNGTFAWERPMTGYTIQTDDTGVYVPGYQTGTGVTHEAAVSKVNFDGEVLWTTDVTFADPARELFVEVEKHPLGGVVARGVAFASEAMDQQVVARFSPAGTLLWKLKFPSADFGWIKLLKVAPNGDSYVAHDDRPDDGALGLTQINAFGEIEAAVEGGVGRSYDVAANGSVVGGEAGHVIKYFRGLASLWFNPPAVKGAIHSLGMVRLTEPPLEPFTLQLTGETSKLSFPSSVTVYPNNTGNSFRVTPKPVTQNSSAYVTAFTNAGSGQFRSATLRIFIPLLHRLSIPTQVQDESSYNCYLELDAPAFEGTTATLTSNSSILTVPSTVTWAAGQTRATFQLVVGKTSQQAVRSVTVTLGERTWTTQITINP